MSVGILGLTESQFVAEAKHLDLTPAAAARGWRQLFREGTLPAAFEGKVQLPSMPCLLYTSPSPRDKTVSRMPSSA